MTAPALADMPTAGGFLLVLAIMLPIAGVLLQFMLGGRQAERIALLVMPAGLAVAVAVTAALVRSGRPLVYHLGSLAPPLGLSLRADGFSALMLMTTALIVGAIGLFARADFATPTGPVEARQPFVFWTLLLALWSALAVVFLGQDLFTLYVGLELLTFGAVPLVSLDGRAETLTAALRYLLFALFGSALFLAGTVLFYGEYGTLDIALLAARTHPDTTSAIAVAMMTAGLLAKTALFPFHLWLPPAHAGAPAPASALLSSLVVKGPFFLVVRLWFGAMPGLTDLPAAQLLGALGAGAVLFGGVLALRQPRLKPLIAYSTVAQLGYLFLMFPLAGGEGLPASVRMAVWTGGAVQAVSHAFAKAAMFAGAGLIGQALGHDRIGGLRGVGRALPVTTFALALAGLSLMGLPPSGGFLAKWLLVRASIVTAQWWWAALVLAGGLLAGGYIFRIIAPALSAPEQPLPAIPAPARRREAVVLALALVSVLLGVVPFGLTTLLAVGSPAIAHIVPR